MKLDGFCQPSTVMMFTSYKCNLGCSYCYISQNKAINGIHEDMQKYLRDDTYLNHIIQYYGSRSDLLTDLELWGGEPLIGIGDLANNISKYFLAFPNLNRIFTSTNFTNHIDDLIYFVKQLVAIDRPINFDLQVSIDGPEWIMSLTRGKGIENVVRSNMGYFFTKLNEMDLKQVHVTLILKPTLVMSCIDAMSSYEKVKEYYRYFDDLCSDFHSRIDNQGIGIGFPAFTSLAHPGNYTTEDGIKYAGFIDNLNILTEDNRDNHIFTNYPEHRSMNHIANRLGNSRFDYKLDPRAQMCSVGHNKISIMGNGMISLCHRSFLESFDSYRDIANRTMTAGKGQQLFAELGLVKNAAETTSAFTEEEYDDLVNRTGYAYSGHKLALTSLVSSMKALLMAGQISDIYNDEEKLLEAAYVLQRIMNCIYDNTEITGSPYVRCLSEIRLYCNGALENTIQTLGECNDGLQCTEQCCTE